MRTAPLSSLRIVTALVGLSALAVAAQAKIVTFDPDDITIPTGGQGLGYYFDIAAGLYTQDPNQSWVGDSANFQLYRATGTIPTLRFAVNNGSTVSGHSVDGWVGSSIVGPFSLDPDTVVGPTSSFVRSLGSTSVGAYRQDRTGYLGLRFLNSLTGATNYGWMEIVTSTSPSYSAIVTRWAYDDSGASILTGQTQPVPEPASLGALGLGAFALLRRRRARA